MIRFLVTGGAGFIGSHVTEHLVEAGHSVVVLDDLSTGSLDNLSSIKNDILFHQADIRDRDVVLKALKGVDVVLHLAAQGSVPRSIEHPRQVADVNIMGTITVLEAARDAGVQRVVFSSSSSVYGAINVPQQVESLPPEPYSPYALTKFTGEQYCQQFSEHYDLETVCLRYFNVFGPRQNPHSQYSAVIPTFISALLEKKPVVIHGTGEQSRDFTFVENVVDANLKAATSSQVGAGEVINIAAGGSISINELYGQLQKLLNVTVDAEYGPGRPGDIPLSHADVSRAKKLLNHEPLVSFSDGLARTVGWYTSAFTPTLNIPAGNGESSLA